MIEDFEARLADEQAGAEHKFGTLYPGRIVELELVHGHKLVQKSARIINASNSNSTHATHAENSDTDSQHHSTESKRDEKGNGVEDSACHQDIRNDSQNGATTPKITEKESRYNVVVLDIQEDQQNGLQDCCVFLVPQATPYSFPPESSPSLIQNMKLCFSLMWSHELYSWYKEGTLNLQWQSQPREMSSSLHIPPLCSRSASILSMCIVNEYIW